MTYTTIRINQEADLIWSEDPNISEAVSVNLFTGYVLLMFYMILYNPSIIRFLDLLCRGEERRSILPIINVRRNDEISSLMTLISSSESKWKESISGNFHVNK